MTIASPSWLATQPPTPMTTDALCCLSSFQRPSWLKTFSWAFSRIEQVLIRMTSASARILGQYEPVRRAEHVGHLGRVVLVHLATVGLDVQLSGHGNWRIVSKPSSLRTGLEARQQKLAQLRQVARSGTRRSHAGACTFHGLMMNMLQVPEKSSAWLARSHPDLMVSASAAADTLYKCEGPGGSVAYTNKKASFTAARRSAATRPPSRRPKSAQARRKVDYQERPDVRATSSGVASTAAIVAGVAAKAPLCVEARPKQKSATR